MKRKHLADDIIRKKCGPVGQTFLWLRQALLSDQNGQTRRFMLL